MRDPYVGRLALARTPRERLAPGAFARAPRGPV